LQRNFIAIGVNSLLDGIGLDQFWAYELVALGMKTWLQLAVIG
jgi:hypothetical protein